MIPLSFHLVYVVVLQDGSNLLNIYIYICSINCFHLEGRPHITALMRGQPTASQWKPQLGTFGLEDKRIIIWWKTVQHTDPLSRITSQAVAFVPINCHLYKQHIPTLKYGPFHWNLSAKPASGLGMGNQLHPHRIMEYITHPCPKVNVV